MLPTLSPMTEPVSPSDGLAVLHLFCKISPSSQGPAIRSAIAGAREAGNQVVTAALLGHKADIGFMILGRDLWQLRSLQTALTSAGLEIVDSFVSLTEVSEYATGLPEAMKETRLRPQLPPEGKPAFCFYPMSKRRGEKDNWFTLPADERSALMHEHGTSGRAFAGRILQVITGSTGLDDYEWGVSLFGQHPDDLKEVVYTLRFDEASAVYAEFGPFYVGMVEDLDVVLSQVGCG